MKRWHLNAQDAIQQLGDTWEYVSRKPGRFYLWSSGEFGPAFAPDVAWLFREAEQDKVIVWEIESGAPDVKRICGDTLLASLLRKNNAFCYLKADAKSKELGVKARFDEHSKWLNDRLIGKRGDRRISPDIAAFFLVVEKGMRENTEIYVSVAKNKTKLLERIPTRVVELPYQEVEDMQKRLRQDSMICKWK